VGIPGIAGKLLQRLEAGLQKYKLRDYNSMVQSIHKYGMADKSDQELKDCSLRLKEAARKGTELKELLPEAFALVREAAGRVLGMRHYDVQLIAGMALFEGRLVEMQTGEGKTLAAVLTAYLHALSGRGVHVLTFNDYLASRDAHWMGPLYDFLGISVGYIQSGLKAAERQKAYQADVTYLTAKEAGFDFLRDGLSWSKEELVQRPFHVALVDEADSILIDEARIPLVIAGEASGDAAESSGKFAALVAGLTEGIHYDTDGPKRNVFLQEAGADLVEAKLQCGSLYEEENSGILTAVHCALHAEALLKRDVDYIVRDGRVELIDEFTGRVAENRHWPDGIQAAVEAKEGLARGKGGRVLGNITLQHFLSGYPHLCGMTATAQTSALEFKNIYDLEVFVLPPNRKNCRVEHPPMIYTHKEAKLKALVREIAEVHATGRPILIGTASVEESFDLSKGLQAANIPHEVLNARHDEKEAEIIARAGQRQAVTVSTNMAGRGVDIRLGNGNEVEWKQIAALGGLYVIGTSLHTSLRIDNQLKGRAGRQGDPGSSRFFISLEDEIIDRFGREKAIPAHYLSLRQEEPVTDATVHKNMGHIQRIVQGQNYEIHKTLTRYSDIVEEQRQIFHERRLEILDEENKEKRELQLFYMDQHWAEHLDYAAYLREGIHLESISNKNPIDVFQTEMIQAFSDMLIRLEEAVEKGVHALAANGGNGQGAEKSRGITRPSSTWTYMVNDSFFPERTSLFT
jgi:preprotein translocase subunit SecA